MEGTMQDSLFEASTSREQQKTLNGHVLARRYKLGRRLGTGGIASVFEAQDAVLNELVHEMLDADVRCRPTMQQVQQSIRGILWCRNRAA
jgi:hypothetical protein